MQFHTTPQTIPSKTTTELTCLTVAKTFCIIIFHKFIMLLAVASHYENVQLLCHWKIFFIQAAICNIKRFRGCLHFEWFKEILIIRSLILHNIQIWVLITFLSSCFRISHVVLQPHPVAPRTEPDSPQRTQEVVARGLPDVFQLVQWPQQPRTRWCSTGTPDCMIIAHRDHLNLWRSVTPFLKVHYCGDVSRPANLHQFFSHIFAINSCLVG